MKKNNTPLISIIIPVYNVEKYIMKCVLSLLNQSYTNFEAIVIDDGSPDNSISVAKDIIGDDSRFVFLEKCNGGQASARNMGLDYATGEYISFLDSDDYLDKHFLEKNLSKIRSVNADICICDISMVTSKGKAIRFQCNNLKAYYDLKDLFLCKDTVSSYPCDKIYKRSLFNNMRFDESVKTYEDSHFIFKILFNRKITSINEPLYFYVQREGATTKTLPPSLLNDKVKIIKTYLDFYNLTNVIDDIDSYYLDYCILKTLIYGPSILFAKYSSDYPTDIKKLLATEYASDKFTFANIFSIKKFSKKMYWSLIIFKLSPRLFRLLIILKDQFNIKK